VYEHLEGFVLEALPFLLLVLGARPLLTLQELQLCLARLLLVNQELTGSAHVQLELLHPFVNNLFPLGVGSAD
jgi:hypothetical protein